MKSKKIKFPFFDIIFLKEEEKENNPIIKCKSRDI